MTFLARNQRKTVAYAGDMTDLEALDLRQSDDAAPNPEQELIALEDSERLRQAIAGLPAPFLETLVMRDINGLSYRRDRRSDRGRRSRHGDVASVPRARHARQDIEVRAA